MRNLETATHDRAVAVGSGARQRLLVLGILAAIAAAVVNVAIYAAASGLGVITDSVAVPGPGGDGLLTAAAVVVSSIASVLAATIVFTLLRGRVVRPVRTFRVVATVLLLLSLVMPASIAGAPAGMIAALMLMHLVAWGASVALVTRAAA